MTIAELILKVESGETVQVKASRFNLNAMMTMMQANKDHGKKCLEWSISVDKGIVTIKKQSEQ